MKDWWQTPAGLLIAFGIFIAVIAIGVGTGQYISQSTVRTCIEAGGAWGENTCTIFRE